MCASVRCGTRGRRFDEFEICCCVWVCVKGQVGVGACTLSYGVMMLSQYAYMTRGFG